MGLVCQVFKNELSICFILYMEIIIYIVLFILGISSSQGDSFSQKLTFEVVYISAKIKERLTVTL